MPRSFKIGGWLLAALALAGCAPRATLPTPPELDLLAREHGLAQAWIGVALQDADGRTLLQWNAERLFVPASNQKVLTAAAALELLGPDYRFATLVRRTSPRSLTLVCSGDPSLTSDDLRRLALQTVLAWAGDTVDTLYLHPWALDTVHYGPGWMWDDFPYAFSAPVAAATVNENLIWLYCGHGRCFEDPRFPGPLRFEVAEHRRCRWQADTLVLPVPPDSGLVHTYRVIREPERFVLQVFRGFLAEAGLPVGAVALWPESRADSLEGDTLALHRSKPLRFLVTHLLKVSDNLYAEILFKTVGAVVYGPPGTWAKGRRALDSLWQAWHLPVHLVRIADGSGLSRYNQVAPAFLVALLQRVRNRPWFPDFLAALPVAGQDGTLEGVDFGVPGGVRAKTGTMTGVRCLSGYLFPQGIPRRPLVFSIMANNTGVRRAVVDSLIGDFLQRVHQAALAGGL